MYIQIYIYIYQAVALLKVTISTLNLDDYPKLVNGLKEMNKADPSVNAYYQENGDLILATCGEVHLQRCIKDLEDMLAKVPIKVSVPHVSFKETITYYKLEDISKLKNI